MKRIFLINLAVMMVLCSLLYTSCKKTGHPTHPTPANNRLLSYTKFSSSTLSPTTVTESFSFFYDGQKRVTQILYTTNDMAKHPDNANLKINFVYSGDTIYKTFTAEASSIVFERDTFIQNSYGFITSAYTPGYINTFTYVLNDLISGNTKSVYDSGTMISATRTYTSYNGDLLNSSYDGTLHATFPDSGLSFFLVPHDTALTAPLNVTWTDFGATDVNVKHTTASNSYSDVLSGYTTGDPVMVQAIDNYGVVAYDTVIWPGGTYPKESFYVYPTLANRSGDFLQIESFTTYGVNIYQNAHLIRQIVEQGGPTTNITYTIDADSRITQTYVVDTDLARNVYTTIYKLQYETF